MASLDRESLVYISESSFKEFEPKSSIQRTQLFSDMCRLNTIYMVEKAGSGHIGSSFSSMDIFSWVLLNELNISKLKDETNKEMDVFFSSKGHDAPGLYAVQAALGLINYEKIHALRRLNGLPGHPDVSIPFSVTNTGSLGMGVSKAKGMIKAAKLDGVKKKFFVLTGDGELQEGQFWESLISAANDGLGELTVIIDHNKIQSDTFVDEVSNLGSLEEKIRSFGCECFRVDGHSFEELEKTFNECRQIENKPQVIIADTIKGKGISFIEADYSQRGEDYFYSFHSGSLKVENYLKAAAELSEKVSDDFKKLFGKDLELVYPKRDAGPENLSSGKQNFLIAAYSEALLKEAKENKRIVALDGDLLLDTGLVPFKKEFPERFVECGIAEQDMVSQAGGLALSGYLPIVHSFACFLSTRPNEHIFNNATERTKVIYAGSLAGLVPAGPGHSHQSVRDISILSSCPGLIMMEPCCEEEVAQVLSYAVNKNQNSSYIRLTTIPYSIPFNYPKDVSLKEGQGIVIHKGEDVVLMTYGPAMTSSAYLAAQRLKKEGVSVKVINMPWLNRVDQDWLNSELAGAKLLVTLDNHFIRGGMAYEVSHTLMSNEQSPHSFKYVSLGLDDVPKCGWNDEVLKFYGFDPEGLATKLKSLYQM